MCIRDRQKWSLSTAITRDEREKLLAIHDGMSQSNNYSILSTSLMRNDLCCLVNAKENNEGARNESEEARLEGPEGIDSKDFNKEHVIFNKKDRKG